VSATPSRRLAYLLAALALACAAAVALSAPPAAEAAKPCWKRLIDDWVDNGRFDGTYSASCIEQARKHLPEDIRAYSDIEEKMNGIRQLALRKQSGESKPGGGGTTRPATQPVRSVTGEPQPQASHPPPDPGPISEALNSDTTTADSIPLPLILLAGLALLLMAAGATGIAARKVQARRASVRRPS
jgi:hypothetical protein